jgi:hypothetical protein
MNWGVVETDAEGTEWLLSLPARTFGHVRFYVDLLADQGVAPDEPFSRQLRGKLRELRFHLDRSRCASSASSRRVGGSFC